MIKIRTIHLIQITSRRVGKSMEAFKNCPARLSKRGRRWYDQNGDDDDDKKIMMTIKNDDDDENNENNCVYNIMDMVMMAEMTILITMMMTMCLLAQRIDDKGDGFADDIGYDDHDDIDDDIDQYDNWNMMTMMMTTLFLGGPPR